MQKPVLCVTLILASHAFADPTLNSALIRRMDAAITAGRYDEASLWSNADLNSIKLSNPETITLSEALATLESAHAGRVGLVEFLHLPSLARAAFAAGDMAKAEVYARQLLAEAPAYAKWDGAAVYYGNQVLGRVLLRRGDVTGAEACLLASGKSAGNPSLKSFGPNMMLASELLALGAKDTVLKFLDECAVGFWSLRAQKVNAWKSDILKTGKTSFEVGALVR